MNRLRQDPSNFVIGVGRGDNYDAEVERVYDQQETEKSRAQDIKREQENRERAIKAASTSLVLMEAVRAKF